MAGDLAEPLDYLQRDILITGVTQPSMPGESKHISIMEVQIMGMQYQ